MKLCQALLCMCKLSFAGASQRGLTQTSAAILRSVLDGVLCWNAGTALGAPVDVPHDGAPAIGVPSNMGGAPAGNDHKAQ